MDDTREAVSGRVRSLRQAGTGHCGCGAQWSGYRVAHCPADGCHRTFAGVGLFDQHRRGGACVDPAAIDGLEFRDGMWRGPEMTEEQAAALRGIGGVR